MLDGTYTLPAVDAAWQYCYVITVPSTAQECLLSVKMVDTAPLGGTLNGVAIDVTTDAEKLCPGDVKYIEGHVVQGLQETEGPVNATVTGSGETSGKATSARDDASVVPFDEGELCVRSNIDPPSCPKDVVLISDAATDFALNPITIVRQDFATVTFNISNPCCITNMLGLRLGAPHAILSLPSGIAMTPSQ